MAVSPSSTLAQWQKIEALVQVWLEQRQRIIVLLCALQGLEGIAQGRPRSIQSRIQEFCQLLMDYISAGHFEVYRELVREARSSKDGPAPVTTSLLKQLDASTGEALAFNEDFDTANHCQDLLEQLPQRLNALTEILEERFTLEDQLILSVHQQHPQPADRRRTLVH